MELCPRPDLLATMKDRFPDHLQLDEILTARGVQGEIILGYIGSNEYSAFLPDEAAKHYELYYDAQIDAVHKLNRFAVKDIIDKN